MGLIFNNDIKFELEQLGIHFRDEKEVSLYQKKVLKKYFDYALKPILRPVVFKNNSQKPFLDNKVLYFVLSLQHKSKLSHHIGFLKIPSDQVSRFKVLNQRNDQFAVYFLDDIIRMFLTDLFPKYQIQSCHSIKMSRNAQMDLDEFELTANVMEKVKKGLSKRLVNPPSRFLYDQQIPRAILNRLKQQLELSKFDLVKGAKYHNFSDFMNFPNPKRKIPTFKKQPPVAYPQLESAEDIFNKITKQDHLLHYPYQRYNSVVRFFKDAANDDMVKEIMITLYRVSSKSSVVKSLIKAAKNGKKVTALVEIKARFDEESNIKWAYKMERAGIDVKYGYQHLKVHSKIALVIRKSNRTIQKFAYLATGNFNEKTARVYCDEGLFTSDPRITEEVFNVFQLLKSKKNADSYKNLLVAPYNMRTGFSSLLKHEMGQAKKGKKAHVILKMNSLEDQDMIQKLYEANNAGVKIQIIVRGICCLIPGVKGMSERIKVISIVGRYLEHARIYYFHHAGKERLYLASADWMKRNLTNRIEVAFPILNESLKLEIKKMLQLQLKDNSKARVINTIQNNPYKPSSSKLKLNAQNEWYRQLKKSN